MHHLLLLQKNIVWQGKEKEASKILSILLRTCGQAPIGMSVCRNELSQAQEKLLFLGKLYKFYVLVHVFVVYVV